MTEKVKKRNDIFDCAKGLGIIFVVMGHAAAFGHNFYTKFHVLFFFFFAGYMFNNYQLIDFYNLSLYIKKIWKRYAFPYILCNVIFLIFINIFYKYNLITQDLRYNNIHFLSLEELIIKFFKYLFLVSSSQQLCGATWFLRTLFFGLLILCIINYFTLKLKKNTFIWYSIILFFSFCITIYVKNNSLFIFITSLNALLLGNIFKNINFSGKNLYKIFDNFYCLLLILFLSTIIILSIEIIPFKIIQSWVYTILGTLFIYCLSILLKNILHIAYKIIVFIGQHTLSILCLHFLAFKLVSYIYIRVYSLDIRSLGDFPILTLHQMPNLTLFYVLIGILLPILLDCFYKNILIYRRTNVKN